VDHYAPSRAGLGVNPVDLEDDRTCEGACQLGALIGTNQHLLTCHREVNGMNLGSPVHDDSEPPDRFPADQVQALSGIQFDESGVQLWAIHTILLPIRI
jgi:hypothetical protein